MIAGRGAPVATEHAEQVALFEWAGLASNRYPELSWLFAIPNAGAGAQRGQAGKLKAEGVKAGVPDVMLPAMRMGYAGAWIEMKRVRGAKISAAQLAWRDYLTRAGYAHRVCAGWVEARDFLLAYLNGAAI